MSLNPCSSGRWSRTRTFYLECARIIWDVLILVVVEDGLVQLISAKSEWSMGVLILVVVEDGLVQLTERAAGEEYEAVLILVVVEDGLVHIKYESNNRKRKVLILVVVEDGLVPSILYWRCEPSISLNPCCSGRWSRTH